MVRQLLLAVALLGMIWSIDAYSQTADDLVRGA